MDRNSFLMFYEVATSQSVKLTAEKLGVSSGTISRTIRLIEEELGYELFTSSPRMHLNHAGEILLDHTKKLLLQHEMLFRDLKEHTAEIKGDYIIATGTTLDNITILNALMDFIENHSDISISFIETSKSPDFTLREADIDIRPLRKTEEIESHYLKTDIMKLYASEKCLLKYGAVSSLKDLQRHTLLVFPSNKNKEMTSGLNWHLSIIDPQGRKVVIQSDLVMKEAIEAGLGVGPLSEALVADSKVKLIPILPDILKHEVDIYFMYPKTLSNRKSIIAIYEHLKNFFDKKGK